MEDSVVTNKSPKITEKQLTIKTIFSLEIKESLTKVSFGAREVGTEFAIHGASRAEEEPNGSWTCGRGRRLRSTCNVDICNVD